jgi:hypothetical protein
LEDKGKEGRIILRRILERWVGTLNLSWLRTKTMAGYCVQGYRIWSSTKRGDLPASQKGLCAVETVYYVFLLMYMEPKTL